MTDESQTVPAHDAGLSSGSEAALNPVRPEADGVQPAASVAPGPVASMRPFLVGVLAGGAVVALVGLGVVIGMSFSSSAASSDATGLGPMELTRAQEVLLVDPTTRPSARSALTRWGRLAAPADEPSTPEVHQPSAVAQQAGSAANKLAGGGDPEAAAALLEKARANATSDAEKAALGFQQVLMLNTAGRATEAKEVVDDIGRNANDFGTQQAALGALEGLEGD